MEQKTTVFKQIDDLCNTASDKVMSIDAIRLRAAKLHERCNVLPKIVCMCGSTRFKEQFEEVTRALTLSNCIVLSVGVFGHADDIEISADQKTQLDELHKHKIDLCHEVFVIDAGGYIGDSCANEICYAKQLGLKIRYYSKEYETAVDIETDSGVLVPLNGVQQIQVIEIVKKYLFDHSKASFAIKKLLGLERIETAIDLYWLFRNNIEDTANDVCEPCVKHYHEHTCCANCACLDIHCKLLPYGSLNEVQLNQVDKIIKESETYAIIIRRICLELGCGVSSAKQIYAEYCKEHLENSEQQ